MAFPDIMPSLVTYLETALTTTVVAGRVPDPRPDEFVQLRRVGGAGAVPVRDVPRLDVFAWSTSDEAAMTLALSVRGLIWTLPGTSLGSVVVYRVEEFLGPRLDDDPIRSATGQAYRAWATYSLTVRADSAIHAA